MVPALHTVQKALQVVGMQSIDENSLVSISIYDALHFYWKNHVQLYTKLVCDLHQPKIYKYAQFSVNDKIGTVPFKRRFSQTTLSEKIFEATFNVYSIER